MYRAANRLSPRGLYHASRMAFLEMALGGITTVGEFHYVHHRRAASAYADRNELALAGHPRRARTPACASRCCAPPMSARDGISPITGAGAIPDSASGGFHRRYGSAAGAIARAGRRGQAWVGVAPHSLRAVPLDYLREVAAYARTRQMPLHMHVSEQPADVEACLAEYGMRPVELLDRKRFARFPVHRRSRHSRHSGRNFRARPRGLDGLRLPHHRAQSGRRHRGRGPAFHRGRGDLAGSDSNVQIDLLEDARELEYHLRMSKLERAVLAAKRLFSCATEAGARSLGAPGGSLEVGRPADFFTVALDDPSMAGGTAGADPESLLESYHFFRRAKRRARCGGGRKFVVRDGRHPLAEEIMREFIRLQQELWI